MQMAHCLSAFIIRNLPGLEQPIQANRSRNASNHVPHMTNSANVSLPDTTATFPLWTNPLMKRPCGCRRNQQRTANKKWNNTHKSTKRYPALESNRMASTEE